MEHKKIFNIEPFVIIGVEEWYCGFTTYMTSLKCISSSGFIKDPKIIEQILNIFGADDPYIEVLQIPRKNHPTRFDLNLKIKRGKVLQIKKDTFVKILGK